MADDEACGDELLLTGFGRCAICGAPRRAWQQDKDGVMTEGRTCSGNPTHGPDLPPAAPSIDLPPLSEG